MEGVADDGRPECIDEEFRRRTKTHSSLPLRDAVLWLPLGSLRRVQVTLRGLVDYQ